MVYGLVEGRGALGGISNPIVEIYDNSGTLTLRLMNSEANRVWVYDQSEDELTTSSYISGLTTTIAELMGIPDIQKAQSVVVQVTKTDITQITKI